MSGYATYGATTKATLYIGRKAGLRNKFVDEGKILPKQTVLRIVGNLRTAQVGFDQASSTILVAEGRYKGQREPAIIVEIAYTGAPEDGSKKGFKHNIRSLAELAAEKLGQREILIELLTNNRTETVTASPVKAPSPSDHDKFCAWVRRHSYNAAHNKGDPCYRGRGALHEND